MLMDQHGEDAAIRAENPDFKRWLSQGLAQQLSSEGRLAIVYGDQDVTGDQGCAEAFLQLLLCRPLGNDWRLTP